jgi:acetyl-CoA synthetase
MACLQLGAIAMPLSFCLARKHWNIAQHSEAVALVLDASGLDAYLEIAARCPHLKTVITVDCPDAPADFHPLEWEAYIANMPAEFVCEKTRATDPAILIYTSGTTGAPKGALIPHFGDDRQSQRLRRFAKLVPKKHDVFWSPADWAWTGGLMDALLPALYFGKPIVGYQGRFTAKPRFTCSINTR